MHPVPQSSVGASGASFGSRLPWQPNILALHVGSDLLIAVSCFSIAAVVILLIRKRPDTPGLIAKLFLGFMCLTGLTHLVNVIAVWYPVDAVQGAVKLGAALLAAATALALWPLLPRIVGIPSRSELELRSRQIEKLNQKLQHRVDSLGTLAGGVSHDFNNLLTVIKGHAQLLAQSAQSSDAIHSINAICSAAERATDVCRQMLAYSGRGHFLLEETNLNDIIGKMQLPQSQQINFTYALSAQLEPINASREQLEQLIGDLCTNAIEAIGDTLNNKGQVSIRTSNAHLTQEQLNDAVFAHDMKPGEAVVVEVQDNGTGMSPQVLERLFEPYYSTKFTGRGLGMAAAQGIVRGHHGCVFIDTVPGEGTTVRVAFPKLGARTATYRAPRVKRPRTVLLVDDEPDLLSLARDYLTSLGITTLATTDPGEALRMARRHRRDLDVVIIDFLLPYTTGSDLLLEISEICEIDAYLTSGYSRNEIDDPTLRRLLTGFIAKPFELEDFRELFATGSVEVN